MGSTGDSKTSPATAKNTTAVGFKLQDPPRAIYGWRLHFCMLGLSLALLLSAMETTIIATTLTTIGADFNEYSNVGWVVTAYLVTNSGFILTYAKLTDIVGQRNVLVFALLWFTVFSGLCAAAQSMSLTHLIIFRALQGVGGSGIFSIVFVCLIDICPARFLGPYSAVVSSVFALASILGPILGGVISDTGDWKWVFLLNVPGSAVAGAIIIASFPADETIVWDKSIWRRIDVLGSLLSIGSAVMLLYGLQTGGTEHPWNDARIIGTIVAGAFTVVLFFLYEWVLQRSPQAIIEPVLPLRLLKNPRIACLLLTAFFQGCVFFPAIVNLPQLNQIVHLNSAAISGVRILPLLLLSSLGSMLSGILLSKTIRFGWQTILLGAIIASLGMGLFIELPFSEGLLARSYGYQVILGAGLGIMMPAFMILGRAEVEDRDNAVIMGALNTVRTMGGCIALSVCSAILHNEVPKRLHDLPENVVGSLLSSPTSALGQMDRETANVVRRTYNDVYRLQWSAVTVLAAIQLLFAVPPLFLAGKPTTPDPDGRTTTSSANERSAEQSVSKSDI
ncbi:MFS multidrug transporter [Colletotrichum truncatum]|uniref:MFS multidrug transporter n=1 Tax=Colletotrichum truncatum TaxID=5467 RepID=A0ACC3YZ55_COLTU|nr:MFS multidrug transporter [Colletotrichum truncatum]KAF6790931.1 MFS multidrug transporter [Colletotrichum truncatum]